MGKATPMQPDRMVADDIAALERYIARRDPLRYLDLRRRAALRDALARWPWLRALHQRHHPASLDQGGRT
ncbi:hypothetical protein [Fontimonas thermophila]|uniref:hypothetical protein n=1 Tax=Fontimonas thermophila TaxID=1076937 RepID=UPI00190E6554|nr:hypothetical protein [Fontimonas thermophila]